MSTETTNKQDVLQNYAFKLSKGNKAVGIILAILVLIAGIAMLIAPLRALIAVEYVTAAALIFLGTFRFVNYFSLPSEQKSAIVLVNAIIFFITGILLIVQGPLAIAESFAFLFSVISLTNGIAKLSASGAVKKAGGSSGWMIFSGILDILAAIFFLTAPFMMQRALGLIASIYLIIAGITMFIDCVSAKTK